MSLKFRWARTPNKELVKCPTRNIVFDAAALPDTSRGIQIVFNPPRDTNYLNAFCFIFLFAIKIEIFMLCKLTGLLR